MCVWERVAWWLQSLAQEIILNAREFQDCTVTGRVLLKMYGFIDCNAQICMRAFSLKTSGNRNIRMYIFYLDASMQLFFFFFYLHWFLFFLLSCLKGVLLHKQFPLGIKEFWLMIDYFSTLGSCCCKHCSWRKDASSYGRRQIMVQSGMISKVMHGACYIFIMK